MVPADHCSLLFIVLCSLSFAIDRSSSQLTSSPSCPLDVAFVVDHSGSVSDNDEGPLPNWSYVINLMAYVVQSLYPSTQSLGGVRFAAVSYGSAASIEFNLNSYTTASDTLNAVQAIANSGGNTNTTGALRLTRLGVFSSTSNRPGVPDVLVLITDGVPSRLYEAGNLTYEAGLLKSAGVRIIGVGVTTAVNDTLMRQVVSNPSTDYFDVMSFSNLTSILEAVTNCISSTSATTPFSITRPPTPSSTSTTTATPSSTFVPPILKNCSNSFDLVILLDVSGGGSNTAQQFDAVKQYLINLIGAMDITRDTVRVGLITFADRSTIVFNLGQYVQNAGGMITAIRQLSFVGGGTNTASAIQTATINLLQPSSLGRRYGTAQPILLLVTYGPSNNFAATQSYGYSARISGIEIIALTIGTDTSYFVEIDTLVSAPADVTHQSVTSASMLTESLRNQTINLMCNNYDECASSPCYGNATCTDGYGTFRCNCTKGLAGKRCDSSCLTPSDVVFILDVSGSIGQFSSNYGTFLRSVIGKLNRGSRVAVAYYSDNATTFIRLSEISYLGLISDSLSIWQSGGSTNTAAAIASARDTVLLPNKIDGFAQFMVVITDGLSDNMAATLREAAVARANDITIVAIGVTIDSIGYPVRLPELVGIASNPVSQTVILSSSSSLIIDDNSQLQLLQITCSNVAKGCDSYPCQNGGTCTNQPAGAFICRCPDAFTGAQCERNCSGVVDLVFVIDDTGAINFYRFQNVLEFVVSIINQLEISPTKTRVAAISYSRQIAVHFGLAEKATRRDVVVAVQNIEYGGGYTNVSGMISVLRELFLGGRPNAAHIMIMITDGEAIIDTSHTLSDVAQAHIDGITSIIVGVGLSMDLAQVSRLASIPLSRNFLQVPTIDRLGDKLADVVAATCANVNYCMTPSPCQNGGTCQPRFGYYQCICAPNYSGQTCSRSCPRTLDVAFVLDLSSGIDSADDMLTMTNQMIQGLPISASQVHVSLLTYATTPTIRFYLNNFTSVEQIIFVTTVIIPRAQGVTNTANALLALASNVFVPSGGARPGVSRVAVVITSGQSEDTTATRSAADDLHQAGVEVYAVAYGTPDAFMDEVNAIASSPTNTHVQTYNGVDASTTMIADRILAAICGN